MKRITYAHDPERGDYVIHEQRTDLPLPPVLVCRAMNEAHARHKARRLGKRLGCSWGAAGAKAPTPPPLPAPPIDHGDLLDRSIAKLRKALATGEYDEHLDALHAAETAGNTRKGAIAAIEERQAAKG